MTPDYEYRLGRRPYNHDQEENIAVVAAVVVVAFFAALSYVLVARLHLWPAHLVDRSSGIR